MSDAVQIAFIVGFFSASTTLLTIVLNSIANRKAAAQAAALAASQAEQKIAQEALNNKVDAYHKEVNGNMGKLLKTTEDLATAKERARDKTNDK